MNQYALDQIMFPVEKVKLSDKRYSLVNGRTGLPISEVSNRYTVVQNQDIFTPFIEKFGADNMKTSYSYGAGKHYVAKFFTGREFDFGVPGQPDIIKEQIIVQNSYDKSKSFSFMFGAFRFVCSNGLYTGTALVNFRKIHVGVIPVQEIVQSVMNSYEKNNFATWESLRKVPLTVEKELDLLDKFEALNVSEEARLAKYSGPMAKNRWIRNTASYKIKQEETINNQRNGWGLFNQINYAIDRQVQGKSNLGRRIKANQKLENYLLKELNLN